jgi:hypothetical protein
MPRMRRLLLPWLVAVLPAALHAQEGAKPDLPTEPRPLIKEGLGELGLGSFLEEARLEIRGWLAQSFTFNAHHADDDLNTFRLFDDGADRYRFNQLGLLIERLPAEEPGWDLGGGVELLYGSDARFIHSEGLLDDATNATVQFDPVQFFLRARVPVGRGLTFKVGKFITPVGYEEIEAPDNGLFSHSFQFNTQPSTHTGVQID